MNSNPVIANVEITVDEYGRYNLNTLHKAHLETNPALNSSSKQPADWLKLEGTKQLIAEISNSEDLHSNPVNSAAGRYGGTFVHELLAVSYAGWISPAFQIKVNQTFIDYRSGKMEQPLPYSPMPELQVAEYAARMLRMSETSKIRMLGTICEEKGLSTRFLPQYVDEGLTKSLGDLLKENECELSSIAVNKVLLKMGFLEELERRSSRGTTKKFKSITNVGLQFGKNETHPASPNETQPRYYVYKFAKLLDLVSTWIDSEEDAA